VQASAPGRAPQLARCGGGRNRRMLNIVRTRVQRRCRWSSLAISGLERAAGRLALLLVRSRVSTTTTCHRAPQTSERRSSGER
jgi:hypothetical protein